MAELASLATVVPPHCVDAAGVKAELNARLPPALAARFCRIVDATRVQRRYTVAPVADLLSLGTVQGRNDEYARHALTLGETVARSALAEAQADPGSVAVAISVSCTGYMMPSLDAHLVHRLGFPATVRRVPMNELGCSAGAAAVSLAASLLPPISRTTALVLSLELSSLSVQVAEPSPADILANILFGDGAAAVVLTADDAGRGPQVVASRSVLWPDTLGHLGMRLTDTGFRAFLSLELPRLVGAHLGPTLDAFLSSQGLSIGDISFWAVHPGGPKVLDAVGASLRLQDRFLQPSWEVLERYGNLSSTTVFFILRHLQETAPPAPGELGLMLAFGPGVTCEIVLLRSRGWLSNQH